MREIINRWFPFESKGNDQEPLINLFCFHHAGGSASSYYHWTQQLLPVRIICVELPGRGIRRDENFIESCDCLTDMLATEIMYKSQDVPFCLFGHSMGAAIAFQTCCKIEQHHMKKPQKLIVAGRQAPQDENLAEFKTSMDDQALIAELLHYKRTPTDFLNNKELLSYLLPEIRKDYRLNESFCYHGEVLSIPITAHAGQVDSDANQQIMDRWCQVTTASFHSVEFSGDHFFLLDDETYLHHLVTEVLRTSYLTVS